jgi:hypothetical protein
MEDNRDYVDIRFSAEATNIAEEIKEKFFFSQAISVYKLAAAYALKEYQSGIDFEKWDYMYDKNGANYHSASFDADSTFKKLITTIYPWCTTPYKYARVAAIYGLLQIKNMMNGNPDFNIISLI